eukprot:30971-Pelagococcus_subviridis.AAC.14
MFHRTPAPASRRSLRVRGVPVVHHRDLHRRLRRPPKETFFPFSLIFYHLRDLNRRHLSHEVVHAPLRDVEHVAEDAAAVPPRIPPPERDGDDRGVRALPPSPPHQTAQQRRDRVVTPRGGIAHR